MSLFSFGKTFFNKHPKLLNMGASLYTRFTRSKIKVAKGNTIERKGAFLKRCGIRVTGTGNKIIFGDKVLCENCKISLSGTNNTVVIGDQVCLSRVHIVTEDSNNTVEIGAESRLFGPIQIACIEGTAVKIGEDCLFSSEIHIRTGDSHSVLDLSGNRTNQSKDILVGNHVWIGYRCVLTKGAEIPCNSIVSLGAIVTKAFDTPNVVLAGVPAKVVKQNANWCKQRI